MPYPPGLRRLFGAVDHREVRREFEGWERYAPTPLRELPGLAGRAGVDRVWYKDEAGRFGLGSFKALGGAYGVEHVVRGAGSDAPTVACATAGNHGRAVAWRARERGCPCVVFLPRGVTPGREATIRDLDAEIVRVAGDYDAAVREADRRAARHGWVVISDTAYPGYVEIPRQVMLGYTVLAAEVAEQLPAGVWPTHVFLQGGVGGFASAVCAHLWRVRGAGRPRLVVVEPEGAAGLQRSARAGRRLPAAGDLETVMSGLACAEVSLLAWEVLRTGADAFLTIGDEAARRAMRLLAEGAGEDPGIAAGASGVAGVAGFLGVTAEAGAGPTLRLDADARVLLVGTEGATDPDRYREIVGSAPAEVRAS